MSDENSAKLFSSLQSVSKGAGTFLGGSVVSKTLGFLFTILLTRSLGTTLYGVYAFANTILMIVSDFGTFGAERALLRFLPVEIEEGETKSVTLCIGYLNTAIGSGCLGLAIFVFAPILTELTLEEPILTDVLRIFAIVLPFSALANVTIGVFRSLEVLKYQVLVRDVMTPVIKLLFTGTALILGWSLFGVTAAIATSMVIIFILAIALLVSRTNVRPTLDGIRAEAHTYYNFSLPLVAKDIGGFIITRIDILMIGFFLSGEAVGIYNVAILISGLLVLPVRAANQLVPPIISRFHEAGNRQKIKSFYSVVARWQLTVTLLPAIGIMVYRREILEIFGASFSAGSTALSILCIGYIVKSGAGPSGFLLMMTDHQYLNMANQFIMAVLNFTLNYYLIQQFGIIGAAVATSVTMAFINIARIVEIAYTNQIFPYTFSFLKPTAAAATTTVVLISIAPVFSEFVTMILGAIIGTLVYAVCLYVFGFEDVDQEFAMTVYNRVR